MLSLMMFALPLSRMYNPVKGSGQHPRAGQQHVTYDFCRVNAFFSPARYQI
jgi:hypothetical protein